ncbi:MAG: 5-oxoprolinase subunit PxpA [Gammaproteobacteria bacterium]|nr:5-oxoprolinase subunit PxpA [Gammaproteobacteria bacterium]
MHKICHGDKGEPGYERTIQHVDPVVTAIDLNADLGEGDAHDLELLGIVSSCNVACGGHAGDETSMTETIRAANANGVAVGAHPSYADREGFGRRSGYAQGAELLRSLREQIEALTSIARKQGVQLTHVKPHGALYNDAAVNRKLAELIASAVAEFPGGAALVGPPNSELHAAAHIANIDFVAEAFIDRAYRADGTLVPRSQPGAVHDDINTITTQAVRLATVGRVVCQTGEEIRVPADTLCIHGDTDGAAEAARAVRDVLSANGVEIRAAR